MHLTQHPSWFHPQCPEVYQFPVSLFPLPALSRYSRACLLSFLPRSLLAKRPSPSLTHRICCLNLKFNFLSSFHTLWPSHQETCWFSQMLRETPSFQIVSKYCPTIGRLRTFFIGFPLLEKQTCCFLCWKCRVSNSNTSNCGTLGYKDRLVLTKAQARTVDPAMGFVYKLNSA